MDLPNTAPLNNAPISSYVAPSQPVNNQPSPKKSKKNYIIAAVVIVSVMIFIGSYFAVQRQRIQPGTNNNDSTHNSNLMTGPLDEQGVQTAGGLISTPSGQTSIPSTVIQQTEATIYEITPEGVNFLANNQLLFFPTNKMTLFTKVENLKKDQKVGLRITRDPVTTQVQSVQVTSN